MYRVEFVNGRYLLCGGLIPVDCIKAGQQWASADGSDRFVKIENVRESEWVDYSWLDNGEKKTHTKLAFAFQCRYCLVLENNRIPALKKRKNGGHALTYN